VNKPAGIPLMSLQPGVMFLSVLAALIVTGLVLRTLLVRRVGEERFVRVTHLIEGSLFCLFLVGMIVPSFFQVILRNFFHRGLVWLDPFVRTLVLWVAFLGALVATSYGRHLHVDVVHRLLPERIGRQVGRVLSLVAAVCCALLANGSYIYLREEFQYGRSPFLGVPSWVAQSVLLWGFGLLAYRFLVQAVWPSHQRGPA
jgi:TRAP-type C4-dicarboxylate transport system permease small subunit